MGKKCYLSDFDRGMVVGTKQGGLNISETEIGSIIFDRACPDSIEVVQSTHPSAVEHWPSEKAAFLLLSVIIYFILCTGHT